MVSFAIFYAFINLLIGWAFYNYGLVDTENEIQNKFNPFQREVRERLKRKV